MQSIGRQFGLVIAYLLPGFIALGGIAVLVPSIGAWFGPSCTQLGVPLYAILAAVAVGIILSAIRWILIDHILVWTGVPMPYWDFDQFEARLDAFNQLVEFHFRYYQGYSQSSLAIAWTYVISRLTGAWAGASHVTDLIVALVCAALLAAARDALTKYHDRTNRLLGLPTKKDRGDDMTNGCHHDQAAGNQVKKGHVKPGAKRQDVPRATPTAKTSAAAKR